MRAPSRGIARVPCDRITVIGTRDSEDGGSFTYPHWFGVLLLWQWQLHQARRGLLPTFDEAGQAVSVRALFNVFRSFEGWWEAGKQTFLPEFVEWVEEQRSKAA